MVSVVEAPICAKAEPTPEAPQPVVEPLPGTQPEVEPEPNPRWNRSLELNPNPRWSKAADAGAQAETKAQAVVVQAYSLAGDQARAWARAARRQPPTGALDSAGHAGAARAATSTRFCRKPRSNTWARGRCPLSHPRFAAHAGRGPVVRWWKSIRKGWSSGPRSIRCRRLSRLDESALTAARKARMKP